MKIYHQAVGRTLQLTAVLFVTLGSHCMSTGLQTANAASRAKKLAPLGEPVAAPGIKAYGVALKKRSERCGLYIYLPTQSKFKKLPLVLVAPAGTRMYHGSELGKDSVPEHLPYVKAGYAVVAYELDGLVSDNPSPDESAYAAYQFRRARAGVLNAKDALDYVLARFPNIDKDHIFSAGHSSAGTVSLEVAQRDPRIKACIAYAPCIDAEESLGAPFVDMLNQADPGFQGFIHEYSPVNTTKQLRCPTFIFHASDDSIVPRGEIDYYVRKLAKTNHNVTYVEVASGDHYQSMIDQGIPLGIRWLNAQMARKN